MAFAINENKTRSNIRMVGAPLNKGSSSIASGASGELRATIQNVPDSAQILGIRSILLSNQSGEVNLCVRGYKAEIDNGTLTVTIKLYNPTNATISGLAQGLSSCSVVYME